jgi:hypothetical protein
MPRARAVFMALGTMIVAATICINTYLPVTEGATWTYSGSVIGKDFSKT